MLLAMEEKEDGSQILHKIVLEDSAALLDEFCRYWHEHQGKSPSIATTWLSKAVKDDIGNDINHTVSMELPTDRSVWRKYLAQLIEKTHAFGLLLIDAGVDGSVKAIVETHYGSRVWNLRIKYRGDVRILDRPTPSDDTEEIGLLWSKKKMIA